MPRATPTRINEDGDIEKLCGVCGEWWYFDSEFFNYNSTTGRLCSPCKACCTEIQRRTLAYPCIVEGCETPRFGRVSTYCRKHHYEIALGRPAPPPAKPQKQRKLRHLPTY
jgi:hypothetical protein